MSRFKVVLLGLLISIIAVIVGTVLVSSYSRSQAAAPTPTAISPAKYLEAAKAFEAAANRADAIAIEAMVDADGFTEEACRGLPLYEDLVKAGRKPQFTMLGRSIVGLGCQLKFLQLRQKAKDVEATYRGLSSTGQLTYFRMILTENASGQIRIRDVWILPSGEYFSEVIRRAMVLPVLENKKSLAEEERVFIENTESITQLTAAVRAGEGEKALSIREKMPETLKRQKAIMVIRVNAAALVQANNPAALREALADLSRAFPDDIVGDFLWLRYGGTEPARCIRAVDRIGQEIGDDPYLGVIRANALLTEGKPENIPEVVTLSRKALDAEPTQYLPYLVLLKVQVRTKDFDAAVATLRAFTRATGKRFSSLETQPELREFIDSSQYLAWLADRAPATTRNDSAGSR